MRPAILQPIGDSDSQQPQHPHRQSSSSSKGDEDTALSSPEIMLSRKKKDHHQLIVVKKPVVRITIGASGTSNSNGASANGARTIGTIQPPSTKLSPRRPPLPPPPPQQLREEKSPPSHVPHFVSAEDLSFADFTALDYVDNGDDDCHASFSSPHHQQQYPYSSSNINTINSTFNNNQHPVTASRNPSLSGFLEEESPRHETSSSATGTVYTYSTTSCDGSRTLHNNKPHANATSSSSSSRTGSNNNTNKNNHSHQHNNNRRKVSAMDVASVGNASDTRVPNSTLSSRDWHERAKLAFNAADYTTALPLFESILTAQIRRFSSPLHPSVGAAMHNVGVCRQRLGQHELAEKLFTEAVQIREECLGPNHLEVAASLSKLGAAQTAVGKFDEAFEKLRKAVKIAIDALGHNHKTVAQMLCHLACLYFEAGELMSSEATFQDALEIYRDVWSTSVDRDACMTQLTDTLCNVGSIQNRRKRFAAASASFSEALDLQRGIANHDDTRIISTLDNLGYSYSKLKDYAAALQCYRQMFRNYTKNTDTFPPACFETFRKQILMLEKLKRLPEAIEEAKTTLQKITATLPKDSVVVDQMSDLLEDLLQKQQRRIDES